MTEPKPGTPQPEGTPPTGEPTGTPPAVVPPAPPAAAIPPAPVEPPGPGTDWEKKFKGLQPVHQAVIEEKGLLTAQLTELQGALDGVRAEFDTFKTAKAEDDAKLTAATEELVDLKLWERKLSRIRVTAPHLAQFEKFIVVELPDDLMADPSSLSEDQQKQLDAAIDLSITEFGSAMGTYVDSQVKAGRAGEIPPSSPPRSGEPTLEQLYELAEKKAGTPEYEEVMKQINKHLEKQEGAVGPDGLWRPHLIPTGGE